MYRIEYHESVAKDLKQLTARQGTTILDSIDKHLQHQPQRQTRNKKKLVDLTTDWDTQGPVWELRVGEFRAFYEVNETEELVTVRAIRAKPPHKTTEEIL